MSATPITFLHCDDWYDGPLAGWIKINSYYHYFRIDKLHRPADEECVYLIYKVSDEITLKHLKNIRKWRNLVGWHNDWNPQDNSWKPPFSMRDNYMEGVKVYNEVKEKLSEVDIGECTLVGKTTDLTFMVPINAEE